MNIGQNNFKADDIQQEVISDNTEIFNRICREIENAKSEILIASAWFTDADIFNLLLEKAKTTKIHIIIQDNEENTKLDFDRLKEAGGEYIRIKNVGFGMMHQKFCVVDKRIAIHGSYNYTHNARKNNHESVIVTDHAPTVNKLIESFYETNSKALEKNGEGLTQPMPVPITQKSNEFKKLPYQIEYETVLNALIDAEVNTFNRKELNEIGFKRSESCQGDFNVLPNALDTVFYNFLNDVHISAEQKEHLLSKIAEQKVSHVQLLDIEHSNAVERNTSENHTKTINITKYIAEKKASIEKIVQRNETIKNIEIKSLNDKNDQIRESINQEKLDFIRPKIKLFELIPISFLGIALLIYLLLFYSSAAYILLFSKLDTMKAIKDGAEIPPHQVFEPKAISLAMSHGGSAILFIFLFVCIPLAFALADRYTSNKFWKIFISYFLGILLIDSLLAYTVAKSIFELKVLAGEIGGQWTPNYAFTDVNFYLVFVMGAAALLVFKFVFNKFISIFEERSADIHAQKSKLRIKQFEKEIKDNEAKIVEFNKEIAENKLVIISEETEQKNLQLQLDNLPIEFARAEEKLKNEYSLKRDYYNHITDIYIGRVENNQAKISVDALRDRINIFLEGWTDFLHQYYAYNLATSKSKDATGIANSWLDSKINNNEISFSNIKAA